jgi:hypothetical protein
MGGKSTTMVEPTDLRDYLRSRGWGLIEAALKDRLYVLSNVRFPNRQMVFPMDTTAPDYEESVQSVLEKVSELRGQSIDTVVGRVKTVRDDVLRLRFFFKGEDTSLPLTFASSVVASTEKMLRASACTVVRPRTRHPKLTLLEAAQFVDHARFGQTDEGSFIINVACPIDAMDAQGTLKLDDDQSPFVRRVTYSLEQALETLTLAIEADRLSDMVNEQKKSLNPIVSSNLCDALVAMHDADINNSLDINFHWSALRPVPKITQRVSKIRLQRDYFARISEVGRELKSVQASDSETYLGTVERLEGEMGKEGRRSGPVVLSIMLPDENEIVAVRTVLSADDYEKADQAHMKEGAYIMVTGRLLPGRQPRQLAEMTDFTVLN